MFGLPASEDVAEMLREDLTAARQSWLDAAKHDQAEAERRLQSDFLAEENHDGEALDFHALRHSCGAWLAMSGAHPKAVHAVMRHSSITLTMDTYGHLFPGQEADTVAKFPDMIDGPVALQATGTLGNGENRASSWDASECGTMRRGATPKASLARPGMTTMACYLRSCAKKCETMRSWAKVPPVGLEPTTR